MARFPGRVEGYVQREVPESQKRKQYTIRFPPEASEALEEMSDEEGVSAAELIRRAINFYQVRMEAKKKHKRIILESEEGMREWVLI